MANGGWYGTKEEWERIEAPLKLLDADFDRFAGAYNLVVSRNSKDWPERSLIWGKDVRCLIQAFLVDADSLRVNLWICASQDRGRSRFWKNEVLRKEAQANEMAPSLFELLEAGKAKLDLWCADPELLTFATTLSQAPRPTE